MYKAKAYSVANATSPFASDTIARREPGENDVQIEILFCGVCHSDLHYSRNEWKDVMPAVYPAVPGHEIVGRVTKAGAAVTKFKVGDLAGVGCLVDSDRTCPACQAGLEQFCPGQVLTYGFPDKHLGGVTYGGYLTYGFPDKHLGGVTYGGYSESIVVDERFVVSIPSNLNLAAAAPLLCAGITTYSPMRHWGVAAGKKVGVVGLGGLGHMGVKFAMRWARTPSSSPPPRARRRMRCVWGLTKSFCRATPLRCKNPQVASTSSSTLSPPTMTSMPTFSYSPATEI